MQRISKVSQTDELTTLRVLVTPFGDAKNLDLHGEYFDANTDFGDGEVYPIKTAFYEHGFNAQSNPHMKADRQIVGQAKFVEQDEWGRWYEFELKRSLEYHDYVMKMVDMGIMGASSGCFPGMKRVDEENPAYIKMWYEAEPSLTPTPAHSGTIGNVEETAKYLTEVNTLVKSFNLNHLFKELSLESDADDPATSDAGSEGKKDAADLDTPELDVDLEVEQILNGEAAEEGEGSQEEIVPEVPADLDAVSKAVAEQVLSLVQPVIEAEMKAGWNIFLELWGYGDDEPPQEAIAGLLGMSKDYSQTQVATRKALTAMAKAIAKFSPKEVMTEMNKMSEQEKLALENLPPSSRPAKSAIPDNAPGG